MKDLITCPICLEIFNHVSHVPCLNDCGTICCNKCLQNTCVFCTETHEKPAKMFFPFIETLKKLVILCVNKDKTADFIEISSFLPYCKDCRRDKLGIDMPNDLFQNFLDDRLLQYSQLINQDIFVNVYQLILKEKTAEEKLELIRVLKQFVSSSGLCFFHPKLKAIAIDRDLKFRCGFCDEADVVFLNNVDECKRFAYKFLEKHSLGMKKSINDMIFDQSNSVVQMFIEIGFFIRMDEILA